MRLAIVNLTGGSFSGGYKKYLKNMLPRLAEHNDVDALLCVSPEGNDISAWFWNPPAADYCACSALTMIHLAHFPDRRMEKCLEKFLPDIIFFPVERYIRFKDVPIVNMIQNMEPLMPGLKGDPPPEVFKKFIQRKLARNSVRRADHTIAISGFVKDYLTGILHIPGKKVSQVYHGLTPQPNGSCMKPRSVPIGWDGNFLFTCGSIRPARGLEDALEALNDLKARGLDMRLVIAGEAAPGMRKYRAQLKRFLASKGLTDSVCWAGNLNDEEMRWCWDRCSLFIMTSRVEACPNMALEALSSGAISIAANNPPLPEFFSDCAAYYEAGNGRSLAEAIIDRIALDRGKRSLLSERSRERSAMFSWDLAAEQTVTVLVQVLKRSKNRNGS
jgi:glycosyltransferase involved in cell wall biosynthesis